MQPRHVSKNATVKVIAVEVCFGGDLALHSSLFHKRFTQLYNLHWVRFDIKWHQLRVKILRNLNRIVIRPLGGLLDRGLRSTIFSYTDVGEATPSTKNGSTSRAKVT